MCSTESYPSDWQGPETTRSVVALYYGSFRELSRLDPGFDWEGELWETLTHELRHHLESLADQDELGGVDYAMEESFKRSEGLEFDPCYYQSGDEIAPGVYRVETDFFIEQEWTADQLARARQVRFQWRGEDLPHRCPRAPRGRALRLDRRRGRRTGRSSARAAAQAQVVGGVSETARARSSGSRRRSRGGWGMPRSPAAPAGIAHPPPVHGSGQERLRTPADAAWIGRVRNPASQVIRDENSRPLRPHHPVRGRPPRSRVRGEALPADPGGSGPP